MKYRNFKKRSNFRKRKAFKKRSSLATVGMVRKMINYNLEKHYYPYTTDTQLDDVATVLQAQLIAPAVGDGDTQRTGDRIIAKRLRIAYTLRAEALSISPNFVRIMIIQWHDQLLSFSISNILQITSVGDTSVLSPLSHDEKNRFTVLYDKQHMVGLGDTSKNISSPNSVIVKPTYVKIKKPVIQFINGLTTYQSNGIFLLAFASNGTNQPYLAFTSKCTFTDA